MASADNPTLPLPKLTLRQRIRANYREHRVSILVMVFFALFFIVYMLPQVIIFVEAGKGGVLYRRFGGGVQTDVVYGEGTHIIAPWNYMTIYDLRVNQVQFKFDILTTNGLSVAVDTSIRYFPKAEYLGFLHRQIGPDYVQRIVIPEAQAAIRRVFGSYTPQQIYQTQYSLPYEIRNTAALQLGDRFIVLDDLLIKAIELPATLQTAIQSKLVAEQAAQEMEFRIDRELKEKERLVIEGEGIKQFNEIVGTSLTTDVLQFKSITAFLELAKAGNSNVIVFGQPGNLPMVMNMPSTQGAQGRPPLSSLPGGSGALPGASVLPDPAALPGSDSSQTLLPPSPGTGAPPGALPGTGSSLPSLAPGTVPDTSPLLTPPLR